jgi:Protein of unknown function (DUF1580)
VPHDLTEENPFLLKDLPKSDAIGPRRKGGRMNIKTGFNWATKGVCGVVLETVVQGGMRYTSLPAVRRFFAAVTAAKAAKLGGGRAPGKREEGASSDRVDAELDRLGI